MTLRTYSAIEQRAHALTIELLRDDGMIAALASSLAVFPTIASTPVLLCGQWLKEPMRSPTIAIFPGRSVIHVAGHVVIRTLAYPTILGGVS